MKQFDRRLPLLSLHIPKCGGQSLDISLRSASTGGYRLLSYYPEIGIDLPPGWDTPDTIVHGHFVRWKGQPVEEAAPMREPQYTTVVRDPYDTLISGYFYGLRENQPWATRQDINSFLDWFLKTGTPPLTGALLAHDGTASVEDYLKDFVTVGVVENLDGYVERLQGMLGVPLTVPPHVNASQRAEGVPDRVEEFRRAFAFEFELYDYCRSL